MSGRLILALPAFLIAIVGLALAVAWRTDGWILVTVLLAAMLVVAVIADRVGRGFLPYSPRRAVLAFTLWSLAPGILAAICVAGLIHFNASFDPDVIQTAGVDKELVKTFVGAVSALATAVFIKLMDDADESVIGKHVQEAFFAKFRSAKNKDVPKSCYPVVVGESTVERWVFAARVDSLPGWGWRARWRRAAGIHQAIKDAGEKARVAAYWASIAADQAKKGGDHGPKPLKSSPTVATAATAPDIPKKQKDESSAPPDREDAKI